MSEHYSVMLEESIEALQPTSNKRFIDATFGRGGHTKALLEAGATVIGIDRDETAQNTAKELKQTYPNNFFFEHVKFSQIKTVHEKYQLKIDGILWDFGLCTAQINSDRGFSFQLNNKLDMGMGLNHTNAQTILNTYSQTELADMIYYNSDERKAKLYAKRIVELRTKKPIETISDLLIIFQDQYHGKIHPATKTLQALRMEVNQELNEIEQSLNDALNIADKFVCISFHSGEDRIVKNLFKQWKQDGLITTCSKKPLIPTEQEVKQNPASRSAKMRIAVK